MYMFLEWKVCRAVVKGHLRIYHCYCSGVAKWELNTGNSAFPKPHQHSAPYDFTTGLTLMWDLTKSDFRSKCYRK